MGKLSTLRSSNGPITLYIFIYLLQIKRILGCKKTIPMTIQDRDVDTFLTLFNGMM